VTAVFVNNAYGDVFDATLGEYLTRPGDGSATSEEVIMNGVPGDYPGESTVIGALLLSRPMDHDALQRITVAGHDGIARVIRPAHTPADGDTVFAAATVPGTTSTADLMQLTAAAQIATARALLDSVNHQSAGWSLVSPQVGCSDFSNVVVNWTAKIKRIRLTPANDAPHSPPEWSKGLVRFSFSSGSLPSYSLPAIFEIGSYAGADAIEIMLTPRLLRQGSTRLRFLEDGFNLPIASIHTVMRMRETSRNQMLTDILDSARLARKMECCRSLVVHLPQRADSAFSSVWLETVREAMDILAPGSARVSIENPDPPVEAARPDEWLSMTRWRVLSQEFGFGATFDTSHAAASGWDLLEYAENPHDALDNVHLSDVGGRSYNNGILNTLLHAHRPPGTGDLQIERFLARLAQTNYNGLITLEISPLRVPWYWLPSAQRALRDMLGYCRSATGDARSQFTTNPRRRGLRSRIDR
jgi:sugar phosphate isomerase/epimerase